MLRNGFYGFFLMLLYFGFLSPAVAQLRGGFVGSLNSSTLSGNFDDVADIDKVRRNTLGLGVLGVVQMTQHIGIEFSVALLERGGENGVRGEGFREVRLVYIDFPLLLKVSGKYPYLVAGGYISSLLSAEIVVDEGDRGIPSKDSFNLSDAGWMIGAGANVYTSESTHFHLEVLYSHGTKELLFAAPDGNALKSRALHFRVGFTFSLIEWGKERE